MDRAYRLAYRLAFPILRVYWHVRRPDHQGALVAIWVDGQVLCVRQSYRSEWTFPGGGVHDAEQPVDAARRELTEELSLSVAADALQFACKTFGIWDGRRDTVWFFDLHLADRPAVRPDGREILRAEFVDPAALSRLKLTHPVSRYVEWWSTSRLTGQASRA